MSVPRLWPDSTIVILASGPSLTPEDVQTCLRGDLKVIAIKDAVRLAPWADVLYCAGGEIASRGGWFRTYGKTLGFAGPRYTLDPQAADYAEVLRNTGITGIETDPSGLRTGKNSGYQAINLAVHFGGKRIVLLGYDMKPADDGRLRWFGNHPYPGARPPFRDFLAIFPTLLEPLKALGVEVLNATRSTALTVFPKVSLAEALA